MKKQLNNGTKCIGSWSCWRGCYKWMGPSCQNHPISKWFFHIVKRWGSFWYRVNSFNNVAFQLIRCLKCCRAFGSSAKNKITQLAITTCLCFLCFLSSEFLASAVVGSILSAHLVKWVTTFNPDWRPIFTKWLEITRTNSTVLPQLHAFTIEFNGVIIGDTYNFITIHLTLILLEGDNRYFGVFHIWVYQGFVEIFSSKNIISLINKISHHVSCDSRFSIALILIFLRFILL